MRRTVLAATGVLALAMVATLAGSYSSASAHGFGSDHPINEHFAPRVVTPRVVAARACTGTLAVVFDGVELGPGKVWLPRMDDGSTTLSLHEASGRSGPGGAWWVVKTISGGENQLRFAGYAAAVAAGKHFDLARVSTAGYTSTGLLVEDSCTSTTATTDWSTHAHDDRRRRDEHSL